MPSTSTLQSFRFQSTAPRTSHQSYLTGNQNTGTAGNTTHIERRSYFAFDLSGISGNITGATLRLWVWKPALANGNTGCYTSADAQETFALHSVGSHTAADIAAVPFNVTAPNDVDDQVWTDLGDGSELGSIVVTENCETLDLVVSPTATDPNADCSLADTPCGKWVEVALNATALSELNAATGNWVTGGRLSSINAPATGERREWLHAGTLVDLESTSASFPDFDTPAPELALEVTTP